MDMEKVKNLYSVICSSYSSPVSKSHPPEVGAEEWEHVERMINEVLTVIQPTVMSERRRKEIIEYIQILFGASCGIKVFPYGSVPLKTYLPDGDIDLSVVCQHDTEALSNILCSLLHHEGTTNNRIKVTNVQSIPAQVKVIRCQVEGIAVDICFNQIDGLCALSFLEQVDQLIGQDHLFKRSVILLKAWCFYESRLLGANSGLISTYALETMVAHIINLFHSSLDSPLAVLYKFLGYYRKFDWEKHCVAIDGLVHISCLPEVVVTLPDGCGQMLLNSDFLQNCRESYSIATGISQTEQRPFQLKFLNVVDPLRYNNNIGRSVNKASFYRIRHAFEYAFSNLKEIISSPLEEVGYRTGMFFKTTMTRIGVGNRPDGVPVPEQSESQTLESTNLLAGIEYGLWYHDFGIYQGCNDPAFPRNCDQLGLDGTFDQNAMFAAYQSLDPESVLSGGVTLVPVLGDLANSRGTGTYIPQMVYDQRPPYNHSRRRLSRYVPVNGNSNPTNITESEEEKAAERMMEEEEIPETGSVRLGDEMEFPPLQAQGKPSNNGNAGK